MMFTFFTILVKELLPSNFRINSILCCCIVNFIPGFNEFNMTHLINSVKHFNKTP